MRTLTATLIIPLLVGLLASAHLQGIVSFTPHDNTASSPIPDSRGKELENKQALDSPTLKKTAKQAEGAMQADSDDDSEVDESESISIKYRIVRLRIPPDSTHRKNSEVINRRLYIRLLEDGEVIGGSLIRSRSTLVNGWEADFPRNKRNTWELKKGVSYTIEVWAYARVGWDRMVFSINGLSLQDFDSPIEERLGKYDPPECKSVLEFERAE